MSIDAPGRAQALYRFFDARGDLLYVGITANVGARWKRHSSDKPWWCEVTSSTIEHHPDRASVAAAERRAIQQEHPRYNVVHNRTSSGVRAGASTESIPVTRNVQEFNSAYYSRRGKYKPAIIEKKGSIYQITFDMMLDPDVIWGEHSQSVALFMLVACDAASWCEGFRVGSHTKVWNMGSLDEAQQVGQALNALWLGLDGRAIGIASDLVDEYRINFQDTSITEKELTQMRKYLTRDVPTGHEGGIIKMLRFTP